MSSELSISPSNPLTFIEMLLTKKVEMKLKGDREINGILQGYDSHLNMMISDAQETRVSEIFDQETAESAFKKITRKLPMVFLRGDQLICISEFNEENIS